jgi:cell division protein FtsL
VKLFSRHKATGASPSNRRVPKSGAAAPAAKPSRPPAAVAAPGAAPGARRGRPSAFVGALRRVGYVFWPERFPDLLAERRRRLAAERRARGFVVLWAASVIVAAAAFTWHLDVRFEIIQTGYALSQAQAEQRRLRLSQRELRLEMATLKEPGRIEAQARADLGMERPDHQRIIRLDDRSGPELASRGGDE